MLFLLGTLMAMLDPNPAASPNLPTARAAITLHLRASVERAFPMFDPVGETRWAPDWHPVLLGDGRVAAGLVFRTDAAHGRAVWLLDRYDPEQHELRYVVFRPQTLTTIDVAVVAVGENRSVATVDYSRTALDENAVEEVLDFAKHFPSEGPHWESAINAALDGQGIPPN